jgi:hypothetical protein
MVGLALRAETPKAVNARLARETMEPRRTEFSSQGRLGQTDRRKGPTG